jgi:hypothetical protein
MEGWQTVVVVLLAVLLGASLPALVLLSLALRSARQLIDRTGGQIETTIAAVSHITVRLDALARHLEDGKKVEAFMEGITALSATVTQLRDTLKVASAVGAAVGPAVGAAVRAWRSTSPGEGLGPDGEARAAAGPAPVSTEEEQRKEVAK